MDESVEAKARYYASLATKRLGAGLVCRDPAGRILLVRPTYKPTWEVPGGAVEADESPAAAVAREVREELGFSLHIGRLLVVDWLPPRPPKTEGLMLLFDGGVLDDQATLHFDLPADELREWDFVEANRLDSFVTEHMARRLRAALGALELRGMRYLEAGAAPSAVGTTGTHEEASDLEPARGLPRIRPIVIGVPMRDGRILVIDGYDAVKRQRFFRPAGGGIEFGESSERALRREFSEEFDAELRSATYLGALENVFSFEGRPGHEIVLVYRVELTDADRFAADESAGRESDGSSFTARWLALADVRRGAARLYPEGLLRLLDGHEIAADG
jgi:8-oxo-dGTP diphosphatase